MENTFRYSLPKKSNSKDKITCPECERKRSFVRYIDNHTGELLPEQYGKCDRKINCGHELNPYTDGFHKATYQQERIMNASWKPQKQPYREPVRKAKVNIPMQLLIESLPGYESNQFVKFLQTLFPDEVVSQLISTYLIGTSDRWEGATVFWFINLEGGIRGGQIKHFDTSGHTRKDKKPDGSIKSRTTWIHSCLSYSCKKAGITLPDWLSGYIEQESKVDCLFGEWLLKSDSMKPIALFESPKSAIIAAPFFPDYLCLATGSLSYFTKDRIQVLIGRNVVVYPDLSKDGKAFKEWKHKAETFTEVRFRVSTMLEDDQTITAQQRKDGYDMADYIVDRLSYSTFVADPEEAVIMPIPDDVEEQPKPLPRGIHTLINGSGTTYELEINEDGYPTLFDTPSKAPT